MLNSLRTATASMLLPAPFVLLPTVKEINPPRPSVAEPVPSHIAPLLPLDALPDENTNTLRPPRFPPPADHRWTTANCDPEAADRPFIVIRHIRHEHSKHRALLWLPLKRRWSETVSDWKRGAVKTTA
jgi:hypothetical protein